MKQVFMQYGSAAIAVLLATSLLTVLAGGPMFRGITFRQMLGEILSSSVDEKLKQEHDVFHEYVQVATPTITRQENVQVIINQRILITDLFEAKSWDGKCIPVYLQKSWRLNGEEVDLGYMADETSICVTEAGVYWIQLYAIDESQRECSVMTKLLVNER